jgi:hypothetical protein
MTDKPKMPIRKDIEPGANEPENLKLGFVVRVRGLFTNLYGPLTFHPDYTEGDKLPNLTQEQIEEAGKAAIKKWTIN